MVSFHTPPFWNKPASTFHFVVVIFKENISKTGISATSFFMIGAELFGTV